MYTFIKLFLRQIYSYIFYIYKLNNLKVIDDFIFSMFDQILSKTTSKFYTERVAFWNSKIHFKKYNRSRIFKFRWIHKKPNQCIYDEFASGLVFVNRDMYLFLKILLEALILVLLWLRSAWYTHRAKKTCHDKKRSGCATERGKPKTQGDPAHPTQKDGPNRGGPAAALPIPLQSQVNWPKTSQFMIIGWMKI